MFDKVLIANRGEIALRINRACHELGIKTVSVHSTADRDAMHVRLSDESVCIGPPSLSESYLNIPSIIAAAEVSGAEAIHPGYGFLSENAKFASIVEEHGLNFIGPTSEHIKMMGDKIQARNTISSLGIPIVPGSSKPITNTKELELKAKEIGYPLIIKASAGGGGRGMKVAHTEEELENAWKLARSEAKSGFGIDHVYIERYLSGPRHIEFQIFADSFGNVIHFGCRDCSLQRRHQKILEEAPSPALNKEMQKKMGDQICKAIKKLGYLGIGTVEMLYEGGEFYFIEMNTRLQVEHPITEMITGIDLVREQLRVASGSALSLKQKDISFNGHSIECRINAENPEDFTASPGRVTAYHAPGGLGVRVDSALYSGYTVPAYYDSLISKLVVHGNTRDEAIFRLRRALKEYVIEGMQTTIPLHLKLIESPDFMNGIYDIHWLESFINKNKKL